MNMNSARESPATRIFAVGIAGWMLLMSGCATRNAEQLPPAANDFNCRQGGAPPPVYRCAVPAAQPAASVTEMLAHDGSRYFRIFIDSRTTHRLTMLDGRTLLSDWQRSCESPRDVANAIRSKQHAMAETELACAVDRTLQEAGICPGDWYWVNPDGTPLETTVAQFEGKRLVTYLACRASSSPHDPRTTVAPL